MREWFAGTPRSVSKTEYDSPAASVRGGSATPSARPSFTGSVGALNLRTQPGARGGPNGAPDYAGPGPGPLYNPYAPSAPSVTSARSIGSVSEVPRLGSYAPVSPSAAPHVRCRFPRPALRPPSPRRSAWQAMRKASTFGPSGTNSGAWRSHTTSRQPSSTEGGPGPWASAASGYGPETTFQHGPPRLEKRSVPGVTGAARPPPGPAVVPRSFSLTAATAPPSPYSPYSPYSSHSPYAARTPQTPPGERVGGLGWEAGSEVVVPWIAADERDGDGRAFGYGDGGAGIGRGPSRGGRLRSRAESGEGGAAARYMNAIVLCCVPWSGNHATRPLVCCCVVASTLASINTPCMVAIPLIVPSLTSHSTPLHHPPHPVTPTHPSQPRLTSQSTPCPLPTPAGPLAPHRQSPRVSVARVAARRPLRWRSFKGLWLR